MKKLSKSLVLFGAAILIYLTGVFGVSVLNNVHLRYLCGFGEKTVLIHALNGAGATGFLVSGKSGKKYIMTNNHVCELFKSGPVFGTYRGDEYVLDIEKSYPLNDLCAIKAPYTSGKGFKVAKNYTIGNSTYTLGHPQLEPLSLSIGELSETVFITIMKKQNATPEECSGPTYELIEDTNPFGLALGILNFCVRHLEANTSSMVILPGNSGSPVLDIWGSVVGVVFAANEAGTRSYVVPLSYLQDFLKSL